MSLYVCREEPLGWWTKSWTQRLATMVVTEGGCWERSSAFRETALMRGPSSVSLRLSEEDALRDGGGGEELSQK